MPRGYKRRLSLDLSKADDTILQGLAHAQGSTMAEVLRKALVVYHNIQVKLEQGKVVVIKDPRTGEEYELVFI
jgi:hypothetical protein